MCIQAILLRNRHWQKSKNKKHKDLISSQQYAGAIKANK